MPTGLKRLHHTGHLHFITCSCFRHLPLLGSPEARDLLLQILEETQDKYHFDLPGYVLMPEHIHLLLSEPKQGTIATIMQVLKQRFTQNWKKRNPALYENLSRQAGHPTTIPTWETRYYNFDVSTPEKRAEKLTYIHNNPVRRTLTTHSEHWKWSSIHKT